MTVGNYPRKTPSKDQEEGKQQKKQYVNMEPRECQFQLQIQKCGQNTS